MRRGILVGAAILVAVAAAIPLWLALDDGGDRRAAALQEPTAAGDVAKLTLTGSVSGPLTLQVQSYSLGAMSPRDVASGQATGQVRHEPLRILKAVDSSSPNLFRMLVSNENISAATLELQGPDATGRLVTYMSYSFSNARVSHWKDGKREELEIHYADVTSKVGTVPKGQSAGIGLMSASSLGAEKLPIQDFLTSVKSPTDASTGLPTGKRQHKPVMVLRPLNATWPTLWTKLENNQTLGEVTIELQRVNPKSGVLETYATYTYEGVGVASVEDSGAAGVSPTQKLEFVYQKVTVKVGTATEMDDWEAPVA